MHFYFYWWIDEKFSVVLFVMRVPVGETAFRMIRMFLNISKGYLFEAEKSFWWQFFLNKPSFYTGVKFVFVEFDYVRGGWKTHTTKLQYIVTWWLQYTLFPLPGIILKYHEHLTWIGLDPVRRSSLLMDLGCTEPTGMRLSRFDLKKKKITPWQNAYQNWESNINMIW